MILNCVLLLLLLADSNQDSTLHLMHDVNHRHATRRMHFVYNDARQVIALPSFCCWSSLLFYVVFGLTPSLAARLGVW